MEGTLIKYFSTHSYIKYKNEERRNFHIRKEPISV